jgi:protein involved in temperature-dependent protein secretion
VVRELRRSGFAVTATKRGADCEQTDSATAYAVSNAVEDTDLYNGIEDKHGIVYCSLYKHAVFGSQLDSDLHEGAFSPIFHGRKAHFWIANLECRLYAGDRRQDQQVRALLTAMRRIAAVVSPRSTGR